MQLAAGVHSQSNGPGGGGGKGQGGGKSRGSKGRPKAKAKGKAQGDPNKKWNSMVKETDVWKRRVQGAGFATGGQDTKKGKNSHFCAYVKYAKARKGMSEDQAIRQWSEMCELETYETSVRPGGKYLVFVLFGSESEEVSG